ncbi:DUF6338 family protein [Halomicrococcus sp. NG-SE-24]|uniref:DUF6338 family protein n=1 Tax=Halomicrococcus sp. NG-SE-24 TaxID=3436928 RepID=UPI003D982337
MKLTGQTLVLAALLLAPGLIAVLIGITLGVVEQKVEEYQLYATSFVTSLLIDIVFIYLVQAQGDSVTGQSDLEAVFFGPERFHVESAALLLTLSALFGVAYAISLTFNVTHQARNFLTRFHGHRRNPWQPWEGALRNADQIMVELEDEDVVGRLSEYSRVEKERQIVLRSPVFPDFEEEPSREKVILTEDQITTVHVLTTKERTGLLSKIRSKASNGWSRIRGALAWSSVRSKLPKIRSSKEALQQTQTEKSESNTSDD